ncbi:MAG: hypothetical protein VB125_04425 [Burkholderia sp.]
MLVRSPSVLPEIEDMGITSPLRSFMQQRRRRAEAPPQKTNPSPRTRRDGGFSKPNRRWRG